MVVTSVVVRHGSTKDFILTKYGQIQAFPRMIFLICAAAYDALACSNEHYD